MSDKYMFRSAFAPYILEFLKMKSSLVVNSNIYRHTLQQWDEAMLKNGYEELYVTREMVSAWESSLSNICDILRQTHTDYTVLEIYVQTGYRVLCAEKPQTADKHVYPLCFFS